MHLRTYMFVSIGQNEERDIGKEFWVLREAEYYVTCEYFLHWKEM